MSQSADFAVPVSAAAGQATGRNPDGVLCLVISLSRSLDRRGAIGARLTGLGVRFDFVDAVDASQGFTAEQERLIDRHRFFANQGRNIANVEAACALSHARAYQRFLDSDADHALIFEDDAEPGPVLVDFLKAKAHRQAPLICFYHSKARVFRSNPLEAIPGVHLHRLGLSPFGAVAYTLNRAAAKRLLDAALPVRNVADWPMDISELGACITLPRIVGHPPIAVNNQSLLRNDRALATAERSKFDMSHFSRMTHLAYWKRKWRKLICARVS